MTVPETKRALFYTRDSGGRHEMTPGEYVKWAADKAKEFHVTFGGTPEMIDAMARSHCSRQGDIFLDYEVKGNVLSRTGLDALLAEVRQSRDVSHVFIPRRDRLARPDHPLHGAELELQFLVAGITLVFMDRICQPIAKGERADIGSLIMQLVDYDRAGKDRRDLAQKILFAQLALASHGFSTGGRPPYGFRRHLVTESGSIVRELQEGEWLRMRGHHVVWLPVTDDHPEMQTIRRILKMLRTMPASQVCRVLTSEGIPTPDCGRFRRDNGVRHATSGVWSQATVNNIARNKLLVGVVIYGQRSSGDQLRFAPTGPRSLVDSDYLPNGQPKVIRNPDAMHQRATAAFSPIVDAEEHEQLIKELDRRGETQRGKPRAQDPATNPLGCRIVDMQCGWTMYRQPNGGSFRYLCGLNQQSNGVKCAHNHVDGKMATQFVLACIRQFLSAPERIAKLERRLRELAERNADKESDDRRLEHAENDLSLIDNRLAKISRNLALAETEDQASAMRSIFNESVADRDAAVAKIQALRCESATSKKNPEAEVQKAIGLLKRLDEVANDSTNLAVASLAIQLANAQLFLSFEVVQPKIRKFNVVSGGVITFGDAPPPVSRYQGPTAKSQVLGAEHASLSSNVLDVEGKSLGNVSRGERSLTCQFA